MKQGTLSARDVRAVRSELEREYQRFGEHDARRERYALALGRLTEGRYGICETCGDRISPDRLLAIPETSQCVVCSARGASRQRVPQFATANGG